MKVREKFTEQKLFNTIFQKGYFNFGSIIPTETMDTYYLMNHGNRTLSYMGENNTVDEIAELLLGLYADKWNKLYEVAMKEISVEFNYKETVSENVDDTGTNTADITSTNTGTVSAYNDENFVNNDKDESVSKNQGSSTNKKVRTFTKEILNGNITQNIESVIKHLTNNYFCDIIVVDVNSVLTLSIFD